MNTTKYNIKDRAGKIIFKAPAKAKFISEVLNLAIKEDVNLDNADLSYQTLNGIDFTGYNRNNRSIRNISFCNSTIDGLYVDRDLVFLDAYLRWATISNSDLSFVSLSTPDAHMVSFYNVKLSRLTLIVRVGVSRDG